MNVTLKTLLKICSLQVSLLCMYICQFCTCRASQRLQHPEVLWESARGSRGGGRGGRPLLSTGHLGGLAVLLTVSCALPLLPQLPSTWSIYFSRLKTIAVHLLNQGRWGGCYIPASFFFAIGAANRWLHRRAAYKLNLGKTGPWIFI